MTMPLSVGTRLGPYEIQTGSWLSQAIPYFPPTENASSTFPGMPPMNA